MSAEVDRVPRPLRLAAAISWRALVVAGAVAVVALVLAKLRVLVVPVAVALLFSTFLMAPTRRLQRLGMPHGLAALVVVVAALVVVLGLLAIFTVTATNDVDRLDVSVEGGVDRATEWLADGPLGLGQERIERWKEQAVDGLRSQSGAIAGGVFGGAYLVIELLAGTGLAVVTLFFLLKDGDRLWAWAVRLFPPGARRDVQAIGELSWQTAGGYVRGVSIVAAVDAVLIGLAIWLIGVPFVLPLAALTFIGGFFPIVGAFVAGFAAAMVALVSEGWVAALLVVGATVLVQQLEGNVLQPYVVGTAVRVHPLGILLAIGAGGILWGIAGAFLAAPLVAVVARSASYLANRPPTPLLPTHGAPPSLEEARAGASGP